MTREELLHAINIRHACRSFSIDPVGSNEIEEIRKKINEINTFSGLDMSFLEDGSRAFASVFRTYGMFHNVRSLILIKGKEELDELPERAGYFGEELVLELTDMGLGTCWVAGSYDKKVIPVPAGERLLCVITVGRPAADDFFQIQTDRKRKPAHKRFRADTEDIPAWFMDGIRALCQAPSALNSQKAYMDYSSINGHIEGMTPGGGVLEKIDLGIAERHFSIGADRNVTTAYFLGELRNG